jgi:plasmid segregation protein ParM
LNIAGIDAGRFKVKVWVLSNYFDFYSDLGEYRELEFQDERGKDDIIGEYRGRKFTGGTLARRESEFGGSLMVDSKIHEDTIILILIALHKAFDSGPVYLVTGLPVIDHSKDRAILKRLLEGSHTITIGGKTKTFLVKCEVTTEGAGIYKYAGPGTIRGVNIGSRTVNLITFKDGEKIGKESDTLDFGMESVRTKDLTAIARAIASKAGAMKWKNSDRLYVCGGGATDLHDELSKFYPNSKITMNPTLIDAEAFYHIARAIYGQKREVH